MNSRRNTNLCITAFLCLFATSVARGAEPGVVSSEFIYETAPFPRCHASTIAETKEGHVAAWFGGTEEKSKDVEIWISRRGKEGWSEVQMVANGKESDTVRYPCWNPVLFQMPEGPLLLFYKVGPSPSSWWGMSIQSADGGKSWSKPTRLPDNIAGPIKNKPILLADGRLLCGSSTEDKGWQVHMEWTKDAGKSWERTEPLCDGKTVAAIQPTILRQGKSLVILCRPRSVRTILRAESIDDGRTWSPLEPTDLPNPGSGIDGVTLNSGQHLLVYNHTATGRSPLNLAASKDGKTWQAAALLENDAGEYSYPAIIQTADGLVHITYTWKRLRVKHVVVDPAKLSLRPMEKGKWPE